MWPIPVSFVYILSNSDDELIKKMHVSGVGAIEPSTQSVIIWTAIVKHVIMIHVKRWHVYAYSTSLWNW